MGVGSTTHQLMLEKQMRASLLARNINDYCKTSTITCFGHKFGCDEFGDWLREVDAVDEDINVDDLLERSSLGGLLHVPLDDIIPG